MNWWWKSAPQNEHSRSSSSPAPSPNTPQKAPSNTDPADPLPDSIDTSGTSSPLSDSRPQHDAPKSREDLAYEDLKTLFSHIDADRADRAASTAHSRALAPPVEDDPDSLYPSTMSCRQCFELAYWCSSMGGQLTNVYRYGGLRSCSDVWAQWRFCMRTKAMNEDTAKEKIKEWNLKKHARYKKGRSSEDVWRVRAEALGRIPGLREGEKFVEGKLGCVWT